MLLAILPQAVVLAPIRPRVNTKAVFSVVIVLAFVSATVLPCVDSSTVHVIVEPLTDILASVRPYVGTAAGDLVLDPVAIIAAPVAPLVFTASVLHPTEIGTLVGAAISPNFAAMPMLKIKLPFTFVARTIDMSVGTEAMSLVLAPLAIEDIAIGVKENTAPVCFPVAPPALVLGPVWPDLHSVPMTKLALPLTFVDCTVLKSVLSAELDSLLLLKCSMAEICVQLTFADNAAAIKLFIIRSVAEKRPWSKQALDRDPLSRAKQPPSRQPTSIKGLHSHDQVSVLLQKPLSLFV